MCTCYRIVVIGILLAVVSGCATLIEEENRTTILGYGKVKSKSGAEGEIKVIPTEMVVK